MRTRSPESPLVPLLMTSIARLSRVALLTGIAATALALPLRAQQRAAAAATPSLVVASLNTTAAKEGGKLRTTARPNDVLRYTLTFRNPTSRALANVELKDAIPAGVRLVVGSTHGSRADARVEFSADGGKSWAEQPMETVLVAGQSVTRPVSADRYTHIRWVVGGTVAPRSTVTADFEVKVDGTGA